MPYFACACSRICASPAATASNEQREFIAAHVTHNLAPTGNALAELEHLRTAQTQYSKQLAIQIRSLLACKAEIDASSGRISQVIHPVRRLPPEILSCIFRATTPNPPTVHELLGGNLQHCIASDHPAWVISKVCRSWREAALADTSIWAEVTVDLGAITAHRHSTYLLDLFLERSKNRLLCVYIYSNVLVDIQSSSIYVLMKSSQRWLSAEIATSRSFYTCLDNPPTTYRCLRHLTLATDDSFHNPEGNNLLSLTSVALPSLRSFSITDIGIVKYLHGFPFLQLQQFACTSGRSGRSGPIQTRLFKELQNCVYLGLMISGKDKAGRGQPVSLHSATILTFRGRSHPIVSLVKRLIVPRLQELRLSDPEGVALPQLLGDAAELRLGCQSLSHLVISLGNNLDNVLSSARAARKMFPQLRSLEVNFSLPESIPDGLLSLSLFSGALRPDSFSGADRLETFVIRSITRRITGLPVNHSTAADAQDIRVLAGIENGKRLVAIDSSLPGRCLESLVQELGQTELGELDEDFSVWCDSRLYSCKY